MIGIFDSGVGGLALVRSLTESLPGYDLIFLADTLHMPYGVRSPETIFRLAADGIQFLIDAGAKLILLASHTASCCAGKSLRDRFAVPLMDVFEPAAEQAVVVSKKCRIGVIASMAAVESGAYEEKIKRLTPAAAVFSVASPLLTPIVENGWTKKPETARIVKKYVYPLKMKQVDTLVLGCSHSIFLLKTIQAKIGKRVTLVGPFGPGLNALKSSIEAQPELGRQLGRNGKSEFFVTDLTPHIQYTAKMFFKKPVHLVPIRV